jgi:hypothetical protein
MEKFLEMLNDPEVVESLGIDVNTSDQIVHDICVPDVKYTCKKEIDFDVPIPAAVGSGGLAGSCRGELNPVKPEDITCAVSVFCAEESFREDCKAVKIQVGFQIVLTPKPGISGPTRIINHYHDFECTTFDPFPMGSPISGEALKNALKTIDGSCMVVKDLSCNILDGQCSRVHISGKLIDKLWKHENLIVLAFAPYGGVTVCQEFPEPHKIGQCEPCPVTPNGVRCGCC